MNQYETKEQQI